MKEIVISEAYSDGGIMGANPSREGGAWAWVHVTPDRIAIRKDSGLIIPNESMPQITNNYAEFVAAIRCLRALPAGWDGTLYLDSQVTLGRLKKGWGMDGIPPSLEALARQVLARMGEFDCVLLGGHPTIKELEDGYNKAGYPVSGWNVLADELCNMAMRKYRAEIQRIKGRTKPLPPLPTVPTGPAQPVRVTLTPEECATATEVGRLRREQDRSLGVAQQDGLIDEGYEEKNLRADIQAAGAEYAVAKLLGLRWNNRLGIRRGFPDVGDSLQVRHTRRPHGRLIIKERDRNDQYFYLVTGEMPDYVVCGFILGVEGKRVQWFHTYDDRPPAYFVPQDALAPPQPPPLLTGAYEKPAEAVTLEALFPTEEEEEVRF